MIRSFFWRTLQILSLLFVFASCSNGPPEILQVFNQVNSTLNKETGKSYLSLSLFLQVQDEDGIEDIESIYLINDDKELFWELTKADWKEIKVDSETWIGANGLSVPENMELPGGNYRVLVIDIGGERAQQEIYLKPYKNNKKYNYPSLRIPQAGEVLIESVIPANTIWIYSAEGKLLGAQKTEDKNIPLSSIVKEDKDINGMYGYVYCYSNDDGCGLISGPYPF